MWLCNIQRISKNVLTSVLIVLSAYFGRKETEGMKYIFIFEGWSISLWFSVFYVGCLPIICKALGEHLQFKREGELSRPESAGILNF